MYTDRLLIVLTPPLNSSPTNQTKLQSTAFPEAPNKGEMRTIQWQNKTLYIQRSTAREWNTSKKGKKKVQGVPQSQTAALPKHQEEEETDKSKQAKIEQTYEKH